MQLAKQQMRSCDESVGIFEALHDLHNLGAELLETPSVSHFDLHFSQITCKDKFAF
jgi:hypothetical protein